MIMQTFSTLHIFPVRLCDQGAPAGQDPVRRWRADLARSVT